MPRKSAASPPAEREWLTLKEAHAVFGLSPRTVRRAIENGSLPFDLWCRFGADFRINRSGLDAHLRAADRIHTSGPTAA